MRYVGGPSRCCCSAASLKQATRGAAEWQEAYDKARDEGHRLPKKPIVWLEAQVTIGPELETEL